MTDSFLKVTSFDPLIVATPGPPGPAGPQGPGSQPLTWTGDVKTANFTASSNQLIQTDNSTNSVTITLPAAPLAADRVAVYNLNLTAPNVTRIVTNGAQTFDGGATALTINLQGMGYEFEFLGSGLWSVKVFVPPDALLPLFDAAGAASNVSTALTPRIESLERRPTPTTQPNFFSLRAIGSLTTGAVGKPGHFVRFGFTAIAVHVEAGTAPTSTCTIQVQVNGTTAYTITLNAGASSLDDTAASIVIPDGAKVTLNCVATGGAADVEVTLADQVGTYVAPVLTVGTVNINSTTPQAGAMAFTFTYAAKDANDELDHFAVRYTTGATAPATTVAGTAAPDVSPNGQLTQYTVQITGLANSQQYSVAVFPIGADNLVGTAGAASITTLAPDTTPPASGTLALQNGTKNAYGGTLQYTPDPTATDFAGIWLREGRSTTTSPTTVTSGHPANGGTGTGSGLWVPGNGDTSPLFVAITDGTPSQNFAFSAFPQDTTGNVQATPATAHFFTSAAPTGGQGQYALVPQAFVPNYSQDFTGLTTATLTNDFALDQGWAHQTQGPSARSNWAIVNDAGLGKNICRMTGQNITNGWYTSSAGSYNSTWAGGITNGTGRYGARGNLAGAAHQFTYGAWEIKCRLLTPFAANWKGGTIMLWPMTGWPQDELDVWEVFNSGERQTNLHYNDGTKSAGTQISIKATYDITQWTYVTVLWEKPNTATGDPSRLRVWYNGGSPIFDSGLPSASIAAVPAGTSQTKINYLLTNPSVLQLGFSLAYTNYSGAGFGASVSPQNFDIASINMWTAP